jgi:hypothetical protein
MYMPVESAVLTTSHGQQWADLGRQLREVETLIASHEFTPINHSNVSGVCVSDSIMHRCSDLVSLYSGVVQTSQREAGGVHRVVPKVSAMCQSLSAAEQSSISNKNTNVIYILHRSIQTQLSSVFYDCLHGHGSIKGSAQGTKCSLFDSYTYPLRK